MWEGFNIISYHASRCEYLFVDGNIEQDEENEGDDAVDNQVGVDQISLNNYNHDDTVMTS